MTNQIVECPENALVFVRSFEPEKIADVFPYSYELGGLLNETYQDYNAAVANALDALGFEKIGDTYCD